MKRTALGKGLDALFVDNASDTGVTTRVVPLADIEPNPDQPRRRFDDDALAELSQSIAEHGVLQPLLVRPLDSGAYQIVAGERRWRAARLAGLKELPVVVRELTDKEAAEAALIENLQREDLNPVEEAQGFKALMDGFSLTQEEAAQRVGKSRPAVANALRLLSLPQPVLDDVAAGTLSAGHARALLALPHDDIPAAAQEIIRRGLTVRDVERMGSKKQKGSPRSRQAADPAVRELELALTQELGRPVKIQASKGQGKLTIEFYSHDDLKALAHRITNE